MTSLPGPPQDQHPHARAGGSAAPTGMDPDALRELSDRLHQQIALVLDEFTAGAGATPGSAQPQSPSFSRPASVPPVRMEQMARAPEPTADLDDLVDLLVPRLLEKLVPALRAALADD